MKLVLAMLLASLVAARNLHGQQFQDLLTRGQTALRAGDAAMALSSADSAIEAESERWEGHYLRGLALLQLGRLEDGRVSAVQAMLCAPADKAGDVERLLTVIDARRAEASSVGVDPQELARIEVETALAELRTATEKTADERPDVYRSVLQRTDRVLSLTKDSVLTWQVRAVAALELDLVREARRASANLLRLGAAGSADPAIKGLLVRLNQKGYLVTEEAALRDASAKLDAFADAVKSGKLVLAEQLLDQADDAMPGTPGAGAGRARLQLARGDAAGALRRLSELGPSGFPKNLHEWQNAEQLLLQDRDTNLLRQRLSTSEYRELAQVRRMREPIEGYRATDNAHVFPDSMLPRRVKHVATGIVLVLVGPGRFTMGSAATERGRDEDEQQNEIAVPRPFYLGIKEVTQKEWRTIMPLPDQPFPGNDYPVTMVSWQDCGEFVRKIGARLPTEAEWEYACRAGTDTPFSYGTEPDRRYMVWASLEVQGPSKVGSKQPNQWDFYDMHGNVLEWCDDIALPYGSNATPAGHSGARVVRGGSWASQAAHCRSADRGSLGEKNKSPVVGLRVVVDVPLELGF